MKGIETMGGLKMSNYTKDKDIERFLNKFNISPSGCWEWGAGLGSKGYGLFWFNNRMTRAHRFSYEYFRGSIPSDKQLDHLCRNRKCVNPEHLEIVTNKENIERGLTGMTNKLKTHCSQGHIYSEDNIYYRVDEKGHIHRHCKTCVDNNRKLRQALSKVESK